MNNKQTIEEVEQAAMHLVVRAVKDFFPQAKDIFRQETDLPQDVAEDCTAEALQTLGRQICDIVYLAKLITKKQFGYFSPTANRQ